jgi:hypothetical protein
VTFDCKSHTPSPYQLCYCSICRKTAGGGGYAINLGAIADTLRFDAKQGSINVFRAEIRQEDGRCETSTGERSFCTHCGTALWLFSPEWPELIHPFASAIDSDLPVPTSRVHLMLRFKARWIEPRIAEGDACFDLYPKESLEDWHKRNGVWVE